jgi:hypothetical protein
MTYRTKIKPHVDLEVHAADIAMRQGKLGVAFSHLELNGPVQQENRLSEHGCFGYFSTTRRFCG